MTVNLTFRTLEERDAFLERVLPERVAQDDEPGHYTMPDGVEFWIHLCAITFDIPDTSCSEH